MQPNVTAIVPFDQGLFVEVSVDSSQFEELSSRELPAKLGEGLTLLRNAIKAISLEAVEAIQEIKDRIEVTELEIEAGLGIKAEGNVYIVKGTSTANFKVKFKIKLDAKTDAEHS